MLKNEELILDKLSDLVRATEKSNELKEYELQAKNREVIAIEKSNELKERQLKILEENNLSDLQKKHNELSYARRISELTENEKEVLSDKMKNFFN